MLPLKNLRKAEREDDTPDEVEVTQAGRSITSLSAERNFEAIRSRNASSIFSSEDSSSFLLARRPMESGVYAMSGALHIPRTSSPLNPSSPSSSSGSSDKSDIRVSEGDHVRNARLGGRKRTSGSKSSKRQEESDIGIQRPRTDSLQQRLRLSVGESETVARFGRSESPKLLKDLGRDYSRYPSSASLKPTLKPAGQVRTESDASFIPLLATTARNPFGDSQADLHECGFPDDRIGIFNPYYGGEKGFILYADEIEADDVFHTPGPDDEKNDRPKFSDYTDVRSLVSAVGGIILILGLVCVFILLPVLTFTTRIYGGHSDVSVIDYGPPWAHVNNRTYPLLQGIRTGLIDPDTPDHAMTRASTLDGSTLNLVFSDEFNMDNRTFYPGDDPYWTAPSIWYGSTQDLEWYDPAAVTTGGGTLQLKLDAVPNHDLQFQSGMLNSWNQLCFKGGIMEVSVSLAGPAGIPGLWPGVWSLGNLGRPGYKATTEGVWPYTYDNCDVGITPNQSSNDGMSFLPGQKLNSCTCKGEDHPSQGKGRGAPELDVLEGSVDPNNRIGVITQSAQVAPFDIWYRPNSDFMQIPNYETTNMNSYCGGPYQQAVSATTLLNNDWYEGKAYQKYGFEYIPGTTTGKVGWFVGEDQTFMMDGRAIGPNGNIAARQISEEPMSMVLNLGISNSWTWILWEGLKFPATMHIDYVRIYQRPGQESVTCDPPGYPTTEYIKNHPEAYNNPNKTTWNETGYSWPKNKLTGC
ncbi:hypothetical protein PVAG01_10107 [Phlyctema vagabunda]|uniref:GH16 domain-containing protein n=1 Tax=Phlyctema vagabunda TaxID=108571 RepID=A0ABR4P516_9HELO